MFNMEVFSLIIFLYLEEEHECDEEWNQYQIGET